MGKKGEEIVEELRERCAVQGDARRLRMVAEDMVEMMRRGLADEDSSLVKMFLSFVHHLPTGHEEGWFYALDLGGTNFRVIRVKLAKDGQIEDICIKPHPVPDEVKVGKFDELCDYMAEKVVQFIENEPTLYSEIPPGGKRKVGFSFSFPVHQTSIKTGTVAKWTKNYKITDSGSRDIAEELTGALDRQGLDISVTALLNDTVGTLAGGRFYDKNVVAAVIFGTGTNAAYVERAENIPKLRDYQSETGDMAINMEWGNFDSEHLLRTEYDYALDNDTPNTNEQILEKMISGKYLGELVRRVLFKLASDASFFGGHVPPKLQEKDVLGTLDIQEMLHDKSHDLSVVGDKMKVIFKIQEDLPLKKKKLIVETCKIIVERAARLSAAATLGILKWLNLDRVKEGEEERKAVIAIDGALYETNEKFRICLEKTLKNELLEAEAAERVELKVIKDASGIGAALIGASHSVSPSENARK